MAVLQEENSVFISYSRRDKEFVRKLVSAFNRRGRDVWIDWEDIPLTADWRAEIYDGIDKANDFVFVISPDSIKSEVCGEELAHAVQQNKRIVPLLLREVDDYESIHPKLASHNWILFHQYKTDDEFERVFQKLLDALDTDLDHKRAHTRLLARAIEWEQKDRNPSLLLRGNDLSEFEFWLSQSANKSPSPTQLQAEYIFTSRQGQRRRGRVIGASLSAGFVIATTLAIFAAFLWRDAEAARSEAQQAETAAIRERETARSLLLANNASQNLTEGEPETAIVLALEANKLAEDSLLPMPPPQSQFILSEIAYNPGIRDYFRGHENEISEVDRINTVAISPNNEVVATGSFDGTIGIWDLRTGEERMRYVEPGRIPINSLALGRRDNTNLIYAGLLTRDIVIVDADNGEELGRLGGLYAETGHDAAITSITIHPSQDFLLTAATNGTVIYWDLETNMPLWEYTLFEITVDEYTDQQTTRDERANIVAISPDGETALIGGSRGSLVLLDLTDGSTVRRFQTPGHSITDIEYGDGGLWVVSIDSTNEITRWSTITGREMTNYISEGNGEGHDNSGLVRQVLVTVDSTSIITTADDGKVVIWDVDTGEIIDQMNSVDRLPIYAADITSDGRRVVTGNTAGFVTIWDISNEAIKHFFDAHQDAVKTVDFSADGTRAVTGSDDLTLILWDVGDNSIIRTMDGHDGRVNSVDFSDDGEQIVSGDDQGTLIVWNGRDGTLVESVIVNEGVSINAVELLPDGGAALAALDDNTVVYVDFAEGAVQRVYEGHNRRVLTLSIRPDGQHVASGATNGFVIIWDVATGEQISRFLHPSVNLGDDTRVLSMDYSPDGRRLLTGALDGGLILWNLENNTSLLFKNSEDKVWSVAFSPLGNQALTGLSDGSIALWDVFTGDELRRLTGHRQAVLSVAFSPDGNSALSGSRDGHALLWDMPPLDFLINWTQDNRYTPDLTCDQRVIYRLDTSDCSSDGGTVSTNVDQFGAAQPNRDILADPVPFNDN